MSDPNETANPIKNIIAQIKAAGTWAYSGQATARGKAKLAEEHPGTGFTPVGEGTVDAAYQEHKRGAKSTKDESFVDATKANEMRTALTAMKYAGERPGTGFTPVCEGTDLPLDHMKLKPPSTSQGPKLKNTDLPPR